MHRLWGSQIKDSGQSMCPTHAIFKLVQAVLPRTLPCQFGKDWGRLSKVIGSKNPDAMQHNTTRFRAVRNTSVQQAFGKWQFRSLLLTGRRRICALVVFSCICFCRTLAVGTWHLRFVTFSFWVAVVLTAGLRCTGTRDRLILFNSTCVGGMFFVCAWSLKETLCLVSRKTYFITL